MTNSDKDRPAQPPADFNYELCWPVQFTIWSKGAWGYQITDRLFDTEAEAWELVTASIGFKDTANYECKPATWKTREAQKNYAEPVWYRERFWLDASDVWKDHFLHVSEAGPGMLAYTMDQIKGSRNIQTPIKPGRYLQRFFGEKLSEKQIQFYAQWQTTGSRPSTYNNSEKWELKFATTADEIQAVYENGPDSCMSYKHDEDENHFESEYHPVRTYAAGDLAIAYLEGEAANGETKIIGRALCWPEKKVFGRVYPTPRSWNEDGFESESDARCVQQALLERLKKGGYASIGECYAPFDGAKLLHRKHESNSEYVIMPYLDNGYRFDVLDDDFLVMRADGKFSGDGTEGTAFCARQRFASCDECGSAIYEAEEATTVYVGCLPVPGTLSDVTPQGHRYYCAECAERTWYCEGTNTTYASSVTSFRMPDGRLVARRWYDAQETARMRRQDEERRRAEAAARPEARRYPSRGSDASTDGGDRGTVLTQDNRWVRYDGEWGGGQGLSPTARTMLTRFTSPPGLSLDLPILGCNCSACATVRVEAAAASAFSPSASPSPSPSATPLRTLRVRLPRDFTVRQGASPASPAQGQDDE